MENIVQKVPVAKIIAAGFLSLACILPIPAHAEIKAGSVEISPFVGFNLFENGQNLNNNLIYGGRVGYNFTNHFGLEGSVEFINTRVDDKSRTGIKEGQFRSPTNDVNLAFYHLDALYHFMPEGKFNPYVVAGLGGVHYSPRIATQDMTAISFGAGAKYWVAEHVALRVDVRDNVVSEVFQEAYHNVNATAGVVFAFGGTSKAATPVAAPEPVAKPVAAPEPVAKPQPKAIEKVVIVVAEVPPPKIEEQVKVLATAPKVEEKVIILAFEDVHFDFNKATLSKESQVILKKSVQVLKDNPKAKVRIAGYTSASGTDEYNQKLSERRAKAVEEYLIKEGIVTPDRLSIVGYGETRPAEYEAAPKDLYSHAAKANMRVLFEVIVK
ncbi:OmpA family protein [Pelotalea chapellei]|uniref:Outer membrane beta-barrel domain-containing protein n=1 Tax=Pelotalea chapellei TaxID=44671 RepID=A0ABS5U9R8_9BACT|nr:outer membrane beta-barrel domain-containing protein [Pelotalea chapellei]MBT1072403.1 outer membrane beta-barrel domain-containing protein [Pelotalea chapellei]